MSGQRRAAAAIVAILLSTAASATMSGEPPPASPENQDLELIPEAARQSPKASSTGAAPAQRIYVEDALTLSSRREALPVPVPPPPPFDWQDRLFLDVRREWSLGDAAQFHYSGRLNLRAENDISFPDHENLINDLREVYASFEPADRTFLEIGRINLKSGVALGFNPTDYFKSRAVVEPLSLDPSVLKEDRLGTLMLQAQEIFEHGALTAALAPAVRRPSPIYTNLDLPSFNPMLDRTNASTRVLLKGSFS
ncbi:MAG TPA: hypothetical protein VK437_08500 [Steroidobacteraceae bacterium]|nr:hypothetical protein [Steroidobacteraceae bacterium]